MPDWTHVLDQPIPNIIVFAGLAFLFVAAVGKITGKIDADARGRIASCIFGLILIPGGIILHIRQDMPKKDACEPGYVWRLVVADDHICVTVETRNKIISDNQLAPSRTKNRGRFGDDTCLEGFVWREAVTSDHVCVSVDTRQHAADDNRLAASRTN